MSPFSICLDLFGRERKTWRNNIDGGKETRPRGQRGILMKIKSGFSAGSSAPMVPVPLAIKELGEVVSILKNGLSKLCVLMQEQSLWMRVVQ